MSQGSGFTDKLYWRKVAGDYHCFKRKAGSPGGKAAHCISLCGRREITRSGGQGCRRPPAIMRCARCDGLEMARRGWEESGPVSKDWKAT